jgi:cysteine-rich repeat protein
VGSANAATITVEYPNSSDGFHSTEPPDPVSPAPGANLGAQRRASFEAAVADWAARLQSGVPIVVEGEMIPLSCSSFQAVLGGAGPQFVHANWSAGPGGSAPPFPNTLYHSALAGKIANADLSSGPEISAVFNSRIDSDSCLQEVSWFYAEGPEAAPPFTISFFDTVLHEMAHGLGFSTFVDLADGSRFLGMDDIYMRHLEDHDSGLRWHEMTDAERADAANATGDLHWVGSAVTAASGLLDTGVSGGHVRMYAPGNLSMGSSVSHFDTNLESGGFDELMEPFSTSTQDILLTDELLEDEGWGPVTGGKLCGNGEFDGNEECDDENDLAGDGCSASCQVETCFVCDLGQPSSCTPQTGTPCDDGEQCTSDLCQVGVCVSTPQTGTACTDGIGCTTDLCAVGVCVSDAIGCTLDAFKLYKGKNSRGGPKFDGASVVLSDAIETKQTNVKKPRFLGSPAGLGASVPSVPEVSLECYKTADAKGESAFVPTVVSTVGPFGSADLVLAKAVSLCVPTGIDQLGIPVAPPALIDDFRCYKTNPVKGSPSFEKVTISVADEFETKTTVVLKPAEVCAPVGIDGGAVLDATGYLQCYKIKDDTGQQVFAGESVLAQNRFGLESLSALSSQRLCVPVAATIP